MAFESLLAELEPELEEEFNHGIYRCRDSISNLRFKIRVKYQHSQPPEENPQGSSESQDEEEAEFTWQEKVFSKEEYRLYSNASEDFFETPLKKKFHSDVTKLKNEGFIPKNRIFSVVDGEMDTEDEIFLPSTTDPQEEPSLLYLLMQEGTRKRRGVTSRAKLHSPTPTRNIVVNEPDRETQLKNHILTTPQEIMELRLEIDSNEDGPTRSLLLVTITYSPQGVLTVKPDFTWNGKPFRIELDNGENLEYWIEHTSKGMDHERQLKENIMLNEVYSRHVQLQQAQVGEDFEMPPAGILRLNLHAEIVSAEEFTVDRLRVNYLVHLPPGWSVSGDVELEGTTPQCEVVATEDGGEAAHFAFPIQADLFFNLSQLELFGEDIPRWPQILVEVVSDDYWGRHRVEGYGHMAIPTLPGLHYRTISTWRPLTNDPSCRMKRFFIGGTPELTSLLGCGNEVTGKVVNKMGLLTESSGTVRLKLNVIHQAKAFVIGSGERVHLKRAALMDRLSSASLFSSVNVVLEAFKKARQKLAQATESIEEERKNLA